MNQKRPLPGWVTLYAFLQAGGAAWRVLNFARTARILWRVRNGAGAVVEVIRSYASTRAVLTMMLLALGIGGIVKIARRSRDTRRYWILGLPLMLAVSVTISALSVAESHALATARGGEAPNLSDVPRAIGAWCAMLAWWLYWLRSRRVRETFQPAEVFYKAPEPAAMEETTTA